MKTKIKYQSELKEAVLKSAQQNHIWVNAFTLINPSDETLQKIGAAVVQMMRNKENLLPNYCGPEMDGPITDLQKLTPVLYMSINAS